MDRFSDYREILRDKKYKVEKLKLTKYVDTQLGNIQTLRALKGKERILMWPKLKNKLRESFVPINYKKNIYVKWIPLQQNERVVEVYIKEFDRL